MPKKPQKPQYNPQGDDDVERGYEEHQEQHKEKENRNKEKQKKEDDKYEVDRSGGTVSGPDKDET